MKSLRKSLNGHSKDHITSPTSPLPSLSKPISAIQPPKKVIRALNDHRAAAPQELSFNKGDFFHVMNDVEPGQWYEAHNPMSGARGLVPVNMFEVFGKGGNSPRTPHSQTSFPPINTTVPQAKSPTSPKVPVYYAIVLHDFIAERADELDAKAGDAISVVAQSNREWFVAKPIGRLGRPGLIPVSFVEIRDPATGTAVQDVNALIDSGALPRVEEWKRSVMNYKANSISLGVLDDPSSSTLLSPNPGNSSGPAISVYSPSPTNNEKQKQYDPPDRLPKILQEGLLLNASVKSFHYEMNEYWFLIHAVYQPYPSRSTDPLPPAKQLALFRSYNDFYDFQVELLDAFPYEAGRPDKGTRILPYMPGPVEDVDNEITITRQQELDEYLHQLCELQFTARYILEHKLVRGFLAVKPGDAEQDAEPRSAEISALSRASYAGSELPRPTSQSAERVADEVSRLSVSGNQDPGSDASDYEDGDTLGNAYSGRPNYVHPYASPDLQENTKLGHLKSKPNGHSRSSSRTNSPLPPTGRYSEHDPYGYSRSSVASSSIDPSTSSMRLSHPNSVTTSATSASGRSRSQSNATLNTPSISATNPQTAFIKIKIFDRTSEDLVAIRVHPRVTHAQLMDKVQARLGANVQELRYRDSRSGNAWIGLSNDSDLQNWLSATERLVLYAD